MLEDTLLHASIRTDIPRSMKVTDKSTIVQLTKNLAADMASGNYMFSVSEQQLSGVEFLFSDIYSYHISFGADEIEIEPSLSLVDADRLVNQYFDSDYGVFLNADVEAREDGQRVFTRKLISFIDYVDTEHNIYLEGGTWYQFDRNYTKYLSNSVGLIPVNFNPELVQFDEEAYREWLAAGKRDAAKFYRERYLNDLLAESFGYENYDRSTLLFEKYSIEYADLMHGEEFTFVKIGSPQKLNYLIDQSINVLRVLQHNGFCVEIGGRKRQVKGMTLWIFLDRKKTIANLNELHSLTFLMKLANWRKEVLLSGCNPLVKVSYLVKNR
jgi:hypothetical protein